MTLPAPVPAGRSRRKTGTTRVGRWERLLSEPRNAVWVVLGSVLFIGGGRRLLQAYRARAAVDRIKQGAPSPAEIAAVSGYGRAGVMDLFRLLAPDESEVTRTTAGLALSVLWAKDELIAEEEKALVRRGYRADWKARRRYPRDLVAEIPIRVRFGVPFLADEGPGVSPANLEWSYRVTGARRASLEAFSPWLAGDDEARFSLVPADFETDGPHRLVLQTRVRTVGLTSVWELELPHMPFVFEFDRLLKVDALFALRDDASEAAFGRQVLLTQTPDDPSGPTSFLDVNPDLSLRNPPRLTIERPLPSDLAHAVEVAFEGLDGWFPAGRVVALGQGGASGRHEIGPVTPIPLDRPGPRRMRARLVPDAQSGWADPEVRSLWPGTIETDWVDVAVVRR